MNFSSSRLTGQFEKAMSEVAETYNFYFSMLGERKSEVVKELEKAYSTKQVALSVFGQQCQENMENIEQMVNFMEKLLGTASPKDVAMFEKSIESRLSTYFTSLPQSDLATSSQLEFISNFQAIQVGVRNQFGYVKTGSEVGLASAIVKQPPISRPSAITSPAPSFISSLDYQNNLSNNNLGHSLDLLSNLSLLAPGLSQSPPDYGFSTSSALHNMSSSLSPSYYASVPTPSPPIVYPPKAQIKRQKMIYHCKFGEFGIMEGQFTEPSGVAITEDNEIVVADTNNHRIQVFDKDGGFKFQFGEVSLLFLL